jgi:hypothetical protein
MSTLRLPRLLLATLLGLLVLSLGACALPRRIDSDVQTFTSAEVAVRPALYRFERLPSLGGSASQDQLEAMAAQALAKVGLTPAPLVDGAIAGTAAAAPAARYAVQVSAQISAIASPYARPYVDGFWGLHGWGHRDRMGLWLDLEPSWYRHAVRILLRDSHSGQTVYETTASFDGPWADSAALLPVILDAALDGYPQPPQGPRKVIIELPAAPAADAR